LMRFHASLQRHHGDCVSGRGYHNPRPRPTAFGHSNGEFPAFAVPIARSLPWVTACYMPSPFFIALRRRERRSRRCSGTDDPGTPSKPPLPSVGEGRGEGAPPPILPPQGGGESVAPQRCGASLYGRSFILSALVERCLSGCTSGLAQVCRLRVVLDKQ